MLCILWSGLILAGMATLPAPLRAAEIEIGYDKAGQVTRAVTPDGASVQYTYDAAGNLLTSRQQASNVLTLLGFTPQNGPVGTSVTLSGSGFSTTPAGNTVRFNGGGVAAVSAATATSLTVTVPVGAMTGFISVTNANGSVVSSIPFIVGADGGSLTAGGPSQTVNLAANASRSFTFNGRTGDGYALGLTGMTLTPAGGNLTVTVTRPDSGTALTLTRGDGSASAACSVTTSAGCYLPYLPVDGIYTVTLKAGTSAVALSLALNADRTGVLAPDGTPYPYPLDRDGLAATFTFTAADLWGQLSVTDSTIQRSVVQLYGPDGALLQTEWATLPGVAIGSFDWPLYNLVSGVHKVRVIPLNGGVRGIMNVGFKQDTRLVIDGAPIAINLPAGEKAYYGFTGTAGQHLGIGLAGLEVTPPGTGSIVVRVYPPDNGFPTQMGGISGPSGYQLLPLPLSGVYRVEVEPASNTTRIALDLLLSSEITGTLALNGPAQTLNITRLGQAAAYTFSGVQGQNLNLAFSENTFNRSVYLYVHQPDDTQWEYGTISNDYGVPTLRLNDLPATGPYRVSIVPDTGGGGTGSLKLALVQDMTGALTVDSPSQSASLSIGQNVRYSFTGAAGSGYSLVVTGLSLAPAGGSLDISVLDSFGSWAGACSLTADGACDIQPLSSAGIYTIDINSYRSAATFSLALKSEVTGILTAGASPLGKTFGAGQNVRLTFDNATVGATMKLAVSGVSMTPAGSRAYLTVLDPYGSNIFGGSYWVFTSGGYTVDLPALNNTGTYTVLFDPQGLAAGTASFALSGTVQQNLAINGAPVTASWASGQQPVLDFSTTAANQAITLSFSEMSTTPGGGAVKYSINNASSWTTSITAPGINLPQLPLASVGNYRMTLQPQGSYSGSVKVALVGDQTGTLTLGGAVGTHTPARTGQSKRFTFSNTTANRSSTIRINSSQWSAGTWWLIAPSGGATTGNFGSTTQAVNFSTTLGATGTYTLILVPSGTNTGTVSASVL